MDFALQPEFICKQAMPRIGRRMKRIRWNTTRREPLARPSATPSRCTRRITIFGVHFRRMLHLWCFFREGLSCGTTQLRRARMWIVHKAKPVAFLSHHAVAHITIFFSQHKRIRHAHNTLCVRIRNCGELIFYLDFESLQGSEPLFHS